MELPVVAVLGAGTMGRGIAHVSAMSGRQVRLFDLNQDLVDAAVASVAKSLDKGVARGKTTEEQRATTLANLTVTTDLEAACAGASVVIEAVPEKLKLKQQLFAKVAAIEPGAVLGTNTSSLSIAKIASAVPDPSKVLGLHFFNPVDIMKLLEIVVHEGTDDAVLAACRSYGADIGKTCITVKDFPGFATSRLGVCLGMEAIRMVEQGVASPQDIDTAMVLGYRHPIGPLKLTDLVGLDVRMHIGEYLAGELGNAAFEPPALMRQMVAEGRLGKKTGRGFYDWDE
jgi:3-hydroxybutyryl-CoA dehydrogenase